MVKSLTCCFFQVTKGDLRGVRYVIHSLWFSVVRSHGFRYKMVHDTQLFDHGVKFCGLRYIVRSFNVCSVSCVVSGIS